jgi:hypothetical protein
VVQQPFFYTVAPVEERVRHFLKRLEPPATSSRRRAAWSPLRRSRCVGAPQGTDFLGQRREQIRIRIASWRATKVEIHELQWNLSVPTRVAVVVLVDDHGHDEAVTKNRARSIDRLVPLLEKVAFLSPLSVARIAINVQPGSRYPMRRLARDHDSTGRGGATSVGAAVSYSLARTASPEDGAAPPRQPRSGISSSWRIEPSSPPATWTIEEYTIGDLVSVRPYRGSLEPVGVGPSNDLVHRTSCSPGTPRAQ